MGILIQLSCFNIVVCKRNYSEYIEVEEMKNNEFLVEKIIFDMIKACKTIHKTRSKILINQFILLHQ